MLKKLIKKKKEKNQINFNLIFNLIQKTFDYIYINDKESVHDSEESLPVINNIMVKSTKALSQMKIIELCYTSLFYYKETHLQGHETLYKRLMEEIDLSHKKAKSEKYKKEENENTENENNIDINEDMIIIYDIGFPTPDIAFDFKRYMTILKLTNPTFKDIKIQIITGTNKSNKKNKKNKR